MKYKKLTIEKKDFVYLKSIINVAGFDNNRETTASLKKLETELKAANVLNEDLMPPDVIRFNSKISLSIDNGASLVDVQLVKPAFKDLKTNKVSILTPMGAALIGYAKGDTIVWDFPGGPKRLTILDVEQVQLERQTTYIN
jgi:regulator of nucleoside diphosphate kinase